MKRSITTTETKVFTYLNALRKSGITNMYGASPYIQETFSFDRDKAIKLLSLWMKNFKADGNYKDIEIEVPESKTATETK